MLPEEGHAMFRIDDRARDTYRRYYCPTCGYEVAYEFSPYKRTTIHAGKPNVLHIAAAQENWIESHGANQKGITVFGLDYTEDYLLQPFRDYLKDKGVDL